MGERYKMWLKSKDIILPYLQANKADHFDKERGDAVEVLVYPPSAFPEGLPMSVSAARRVVGQALGIGDNKLAMFVSGLKIRTVERESMVGDASPRYQRQRK